jgi:hypothetical protein
VILTFNSVPALARQRKRMPCRGVSNALARTELQAPNRRVRGRLHVSESAYESPYDSVHDLLANIIGIQFFFCRPLQWIVYTFQQKKLKKTSWTPLAANRTPNRTGIRMANRPCRQPLKHKWTRTLMTSTLNFVTKRCMHTTN